MIKVLHSNKCIILEVINIQLKVKNPNSDTMEIPNEPGYEFIVNSKVF